MTDVGWAEATILGQIYNFNYDFNWFIDGHIRIENLTMFFQMELSLDHREEKPPTFTFTRFARKCNPSSALLPSGLILIRSERT